MTFSAESKQNLLPMNFIAKKRFIDLSTERFVEKMQSLFTSPNYLEKHQKLARNKCKTLFSNRTNFRTYDNRLIYLNLRQTLK